MSPETYVEYLYRVGEDQLYSGHPTTARDYFEAASVIEYLFIRARLSHEITLARAEALGDDKFRELIDRFNGETVDRKERSKWYAK